MSADSQDKEARVNSQKRNKADSLQGRSLSKVIKGRWVQIRQAHSLGGRILSEV